MTVEEPLFNNTSFIIYYAPNDELFANTIEFYKDVLNFTISLEKENECWLCSSINTSIKLILNKEKSASLSDINSNIDNLIRHKVSKDWKVLQSSVSFNCNDLSIILSNLKSHGYHYQINPDENYPNEILTIDPLGSLLGFIPSSKFTSHNIHNSNATATSASKSLPGGLLPPTKASNFKRRNIAVMTSGGDAPGMNANVRAIVRAAIFKGCKAFVVKEGYSGLVAGGPENIVEMQWHSVRGWLAEGGTNIGTARCKEFREKPGRLAACKNLIDSGIDALIVCGGDGSLTGADLFRSEWPTLIKELLDQNEITKDQFEKYQHLNICGTVGSIDNDMSSTDATIGAYSSLARICRAIDYIDATANSHQRAFVVEVMGRHCGWLALMAGMATSADYIFIPEKPSSKKDWEDHMCDIVKRQRERGKRKTIVIVAEGAISSDLKPISADDVKDVLVERLHLDTRVTTLGHVQRGGTAVAYDRILATLQGVAAVDAVLESTPETPSPMIGIEENKIVRKPLVDAVELTKSVAEAISNKDFKKAIALRDSEFIEHLNNFLSISSADHKEPTLPVGERKKIAIINVGAPAGGMNSAVYSMCCYCMSKGHIPYTIHNGFTGLARHESVRSVNWLDIQGWTSLGGSEIGTNRSTPEESDLDMISYYFNKYKFDGLILVGGFEAFISLYQLDNARVNYPAFRIPMVLIPATISNNVPGTEYSLGSDTCLNSLVDYCDSIKQSAAATRNRCFVVEVQGGNCGYIASSIQLATGAQASYVPEEGLNLEMLENDIISLKESFSNDKGKTKSGRLLIKSENASKVLTTKTISDIINLESGKRFDSKTAIPGHVQQGGIPSAIDRTRAARLAVKAVDFIDSNKKVLDPKNCENEFGEFIPNPEIDNTSAVLGVEKSQLLFRSIKSLYINESDLNKRMRRSIFWNDIRETADMLVGRSKI
ncbi:unnamed protein product [[Candida] boidinii]|uniref:ATP-dependent 6-phosphofructokinase n=1 Tax=Candida boidinii TaxID=5477 RepID=A0A9W6W8J0_CANBO|nr:hypothetical protein B5S30_g1433 [[Candida] boidinii]GME68284.1 unnamed protein product [[Candida] boidinii]GMF99819.1 unnamed protein product [[Candida] boidinii]